ncbi:MAG: prepilin-type N-terminal cleavage/methylation domain-containing protein [Deltaproteobacteria bacterium]|nr:prepilin-type N-terminal cleavage/methylation domain-containing protein [Deltaproteobacteria bacterium]
MCSKIRNDAPTRRGFSLIELMIVVAIAGILASVAIPVFNQYRLRSRTAEVQVNLNAIMKSQRAFKASSDNFANVTTVEGNTALLSNGVGWNGADCSSSCSKSNSSACNQFSCIGFQAIGRVYYQYYSPHQAATAAAESEFCASAQADLDLDGDRGEYEFQSDEGETGAGVLDCALTACPAGIEAWETMNCSLGAF